MMKRWIQSMAAVAAVCIAPLASADINIGVILPLTGPASGLGIPMLAGLKMGPTSIDGEKLNLIVLDDATDATRGAIDARKLTSENNVDLLIGSGATPVAIAISEIALETKTPQLALSPMQSAPGRDAWTFRLPQSNGVMANAMVAHMVKSGVKTAAFLGYVDAYGEGWLQELAPRLEKAGIKLVATERFNRADTSVTAQALKIVAANPDAVVVVASGSGAAMPELAVLDRGYKGKIYQTHAAATRDLMRVGGKAVDGTFVTAGPVVIPEQLPDSNPSKAVGVQFVTAYEKQNGPGSRNQFAAHGYDVYIVLNHAIPIALKKAKPGTPEFRLALKEALEDGKPIVATHGVIEYTPTDHWGFRPDTGIVMKVVNGDWKLEPR